MRTRRPGLRLLSLRHPGQYVVVAFVAACFLGAGVLMLPVANEDPGGAPFVTAFFTATSAVCVTGLITVDTPTYWTGFGEGVILALIQIGGFGIMTLSSLLILVLARRLGLKQRLIAAAEAGTLDLGGIRSLLIGVAKLSLAVEAVTAVILALRFWLGHEEELGRAVYLGVFHAVSAFNNAGFALFTLNLIPFQRDPVVLLVVAATIVIGGLGYPVWVQVGRHRGQASRWSLHAKLTVVTTIVLLVAGTALFAWFEWTNPETLGPLSAVDSMVNAFFHSVVPRTAGFNSVDIVALREPSRLLTEILMFIGGGSASTAGGIKVTTFALLGWVIWAELRGDPDVVVFARRVPAGAQRQAVTVALLGVGIVVTSTMILLATTGLPRTDLLFEVVSALGTVGLSANTTPLLPEASQLFVAALMIVGRVGPITLFAALVLRERERLYAHPDERPIIG